MSELIPESVMKRASEIVDANPHHRDTMHVLIAAAIMEERERCANICRVRASKLKAASPRHPGATTLIYAANEIEGIEP